MSPEGFTSVSPAPEWARGIPTTVPAPYPVPPPLVQEAQMQAAHGAGDAVEAIANARRTALWDRMRCTVEPRSPLHRDFRATAPIGSTAL